MFFDRSLTGLDEAAVRALAETAAEEGLQLEFKEQLNRDSKEEKREAAKDVSAFANSAGGRIVYGVAEGKLDDGRVVATGIKPLTDGSVGNRLSDVLGAAIHPRTAFAMTHVPIQAGGVVLVVEVYRSETDLHMVTGYNENRFYRRGARGNVLMTEPEVREAYVQVGTTRASLERRLAEVTDPQVALRSGIDESIIVTPWRTSPSFFDPIAVPTFHDLVSEALRNTDLWEYARRMELGAEGYRAVIGRADQGTATPEKAPLYLAALKTGLVHQSYDGALRWNDDQANKYLIYWPAPAIGRIVQTLRIAESLYSALDYSDRCRLRYVLRPGGPLVISPDGLAPVEAAPAKALDVLARDFRFAELGGNFGPVLKDVMDQVFHVRGILESPYFSADGKLLQYGRLKITQGGVLARLA